MDVKEAAAALGRLGGLKKPERKAAACRANGLARRKKAASVNAQPALPDACVPVRPAALLVVPK